MRFKTTAILAGVLVALGLYVWLYEIRRPAEMKKQKEAEQRVFLFSKEEVQRLTLIYPDKKIVCAKKPQGDWRLIYPIETEGDKDAIDRIVSNLKGAKAEQVVADSAADLSEFGLLYPNVKVYLDLEEGSTDTLLLGDRSPTGDFVFAQKSSRPQVFTLRSWLLSSLEKTVYDLRDKRVLAFDKAKVKKLELVQGRQRIVCTQIGPQWQMEKPLKTKADKNEIERLLSRLKNAKAKKFVEEKPRSLKKYRLHKPQLEVTLWVGENKARKLLRIGDKKGEDYYAWDESRSPVFLVGADLVKQLLKTPFDLRDKTVAEFEVNDINRMELIYPDSTLVCIKDTSGNWQLNQPVERRAKNWKIRGMLWDIKGLKAQQFVTEKPGRLSKYGLDKPQIIARLWKDENPVVELLVGKKKNDLVYVKTEQRPTVFLVKDSIVKDLSFKWKDIVEKASESGGAEEKKK